MISLLVLAAFHIGPAAPESPNRQPQIASRGDAIGVTYGSGDTVYFAASTDAGKTFSPPVVVSSGGKLSLGMHRGPRIAFTAEGIAISAIVGSTGGGRDGDLMAWRSADGGRSWSQGVRVNDVAGAAREGLHAMASGAAHTLFAAWLDLRSKGTRVFGALSKDGGASWSPNVLVYESPSGTVCQCCHPSVAVGPGGEVFVMFRNALQSARDMYLARSSDGGQTFAAAEKVGLGTWELEACPMDGGALIVDWKGHVATAWRREQTIFTTGGGQELAVGTGRNPSLAATPRGLHTAWTEGPSLSLRKPGAEAAVVIDEDGSFPSLTGLANGSVAVAWESKGAIAIDVVH